MAADFLSNITKVTDLLDMGADAVLTVLSEIIESVGEGTEWSGEQIDRLGELQQTLAEKVRALRGE